MYQKKQPCGRKLIFRFLLQRVQNSKKSRIRRRIDRKDLNSSASVLGGGDNWEPGKQKSRMNRIEELPDLIIHHILEFLPCAKDVVRTTVLSRNWKRIFDSYRSFDFDQRWFRTAERREVQKWKFIHYVDRTLTTRIFPAKSVFAFRFFADDVDDSVVSCCLRSFAAAKAKEVVKVDIQLHGVLSPAGLNLAPSMTSLKLAFHSLGVMQFNMARGLRVISLKNSKFLDVEMMKNLEKACPLLEDLRFLSCQELIRLVISSLVRLRRIEVQDCRKMRRIRIKAPSLETFCYHAFAYSGCEIDLKGAENLRILTLNDRMIREPALEHCISLCSLLQKLVLQNCNRIKKLTICCFTLKNLTLIECVSLKDLDIDAPNLFSFEYKGHEMPFPFARASPRLSEVKLFFKPHFVFRPELYFENLFGNFDGSKGCKLIVYTQQNMEIFEDPREADLSQLNQCKIILTAFSWKLVETVDNWLWEGLGKSLILVSSNYELIKLVNTFIIGTEVNPSCCRYYSKKCWRHRIQYIEVATSETLDKTSFHFTWG